jgi:hypothetical protein
MTDRTLLSSPVSQFYTPAVDFWAAATAKSGGGVWHELRRASQQSNTHLPSERAGVSFDAGTSALIATGELVKVKASELPGLFPVYRLRDVETDPTSFEGDPDYDWTDDEGSVETWRLALPFG